MLTRNQNQKWSDVKELKECFDKRFNELKNSLEVNNNTLENFKSEIKSDLQKLEDKIDNKIKALESDKKHLQQQVTALAQQNKETKQCYDELEQCRRLCLRIDSVPKQNNEKAEDVFKFVKGLIEEVPDLEIPEVVIDRAHRNGPDYTDKKTQKVCKSIIVRFTTFRHRTAFYRTRRSIGKRAQVRLDLTKRRYDILKAGNKYIKSIGHTAKFCYADINCRMKIKWGDNSEEFFESLQDLKDLVDENC